MVQRCCSADVNLIPHLSCTLPISQFQAHVRNPACKLPSRGITARAALAFTTHPLCEGCVAMDCVEPITIVRPGLGTRCATDEMPCTQRSAKDERKPEEKGKKKEHRRVPHDVVEDISCARDTACAEIPRFFCFCAASTPACRRSARRAPVVSANHMSSLVCEVCRS